LQSFCSPRKYQLVALAAFDHYFGDGYVRYAVPDLPIGCIGLSLGPQDPRGPPTNWYA